MIKNIVFPLILAYLLSGVTDVCAQATTLFHDLQTDYKRGKDFYDKGLYGKAREEFRKVFRPITVLPANTQEADEYMRRAELYHAMAGIRLQRPEAQSELMDFIAKNTPSYWANYAKMEMGRYYYNQKNYEMAIRYFDLLDNIELSTEEAVRLRFMKGYALFVNKKHGAAKAQFAPIRNATGEYLFPANYYYGLCAYLDNDYEGALESFEKVKKSKAFSPAIPYYITQIYANRKEYDKIIEYAVPIINDNTLRNREEINQLIGMAYYEKGKFKEAMPYLEDYVNSSPKVPKETLYQLGFIQYKMGKYADAVKTFENLNTLQNAIGQNSLYYMGDCFLRIGNRPAARAAFREASKMKFDDATQRDAFFNYGKLSAELKYDSDAISTLQQIPAESEYYTEAQTLLGNVFLNTRDYKKALDNIRAIKNKTPKLKETYQKVAYYRGVQMLYDGNFKEATSLFDESLNSPIDAATSALSNYWKGEIEYAQQNYTQSISSFNNYLSLAPRSAMPENASPATANYALGYNHIKQSNYAAAAKKFAESVSLINRGGFSDPYIKTQVYPDALLRAGDCYLLTNNYKEAVKHYDQVIEGNYKNIDYALYQKSVLLNVQDKTTDQIVVLNKLIKEYPKSSYADDAMYSLGSAQYEIGKPDLAMETLQSLLARYPNSDFMNKTLLKSGLIAFNENQAEKALNYYKQVLTHNPTPEEASAAITSIKEIYVELGRPDDYLAFVETVPGFKPSNMERDSLTFNAAQKSFNQRNYPQAITNLDKYIQAFPNGLHFLEARWMRAESYFSQRDYAKALIDYDFVIRKGSSAYTEISLRKASDIAYQINKDYPLAHTYFNSLVKEATTDEVRFEAYLGALRTAYKTRKYDVVSSYGELILQNPRATESEKAETQYYMAKAALEQGQLSNAKKAFQEVVRLSSDDVRGAEARYQIAYIIFKERNIDAAQKLCFENNKALGSEPYWLVKNYILIADTYTEQKNLFQAKATLQSIVDNYDGDQGLLNEAKSKLEQVKRMEAGKTKLDDSDKNKKIMEMDDEN